MSQTGHASAVNRGHRKDQARRFIAFSHYHCMGIRASLRTMDILLIYRIIPVGGGTILT